MRIIIKSSLVIIILFLSLLISCKSSDVEKTLTAEERFEMGMKEFQDENYIDAINEFSVVTLQYPGSSVSDDAQYYLGECRFFREEYLLAAYEYEALNEICPRVRSYLKHNTKLPHHIITWLRNLH